MKAANSVAQQIEQMKNENAFFAATIERNTDLIEKLEPLAEWTEEPEMVPLPEPESNA